ncbi:MAG: aminotransferase class III-fold pyridoxal phosphate-dependent enzyme, partial [Gammaproteobacteria bacterium]
MDCSFFWAVTTMSSSLWTPCCSAAAVPAGADSQMAVATARIRDLLMSYPPGDVRPASDSFPKRMASVSSYIHALQYICSSLGVNGMRMSTQHRTLPIIDVTYIIHLSHIRSWVGDRPWSNRMSLTNEHVFFRGISDTDGPVIDRAAGIHYFDRDGRRYIDGLSGVGNVCIGQGVPEIIEVAKQQIERVSFAHPLQWQNEPQMRLAQTIAGMAPAGLS